MSGMLRELVALLSLAGTGASTWFAPRWPGRLAHANYHDFGPDKLPLHRRVLSAPGLMASRQSGVRSSACWSSPAAHLRAATCRPARHRRRSV